MWTFNRLLFVNQEEGFKPKNNDALKFGTNGKPVDILRTVLNMNIDDLTKHWIYENGPPAAPVYDPALAGIPGANMPSSRPYKTPRPVSHLLSNKVSNIFPEGIPYSGGKVLDGIDFSNYDSKPLKNGKCVIDDCQEEEKQQIEFKPHSSGYLKQIDERLKEIQSPTEKPKEKIIEKEKALKEKTEEEKAEKEKVEKEKAEKEKAAKEKAEREKSKSAVSPATTNQNSNRGNVEKAVAGGVLVGAGVTVGGAYLADKYIASKAAGASVNVIELLPIPNAANAANNAANAANNATNAVNTANNAVNTANNAATVGQGSYRWQPPPFKY
ncbi:hypothetical protein ACTFIY_006325 [Dictyostelium cf. discoideum]